MRAPRLLLIREERDAAAARSRAEAALADWPDRRPPTLHPVEPADLSSALTGHRFDAAWLWAGRGVSRGSVYAILNELADRSIPGLLTAEHEHEPLTDHERGPCGAASAPGVALAPPDASDAELAATLRTVLSLSKMVVPLQRDIDTLRRCQQNLSGQIDRLDEELRLAAHMQQQFLPRILPRLPGVDCSVLFRPAGYVSGDIYDAQRLDEDHVGFYVADAVGHGVPAALLTMFIKQGLQTRDIGTDGYRLLPPEEALARLNRDLVQRQAESIHFATACYGIFNHRTGELRLARAGHPAPVLLSEDCEPQPLEPEGPLLGVFENEPFEATTVHLGPGDRLLLYSDGFEVAFGNGQPSDGQYMRALHELRNGPAGEALDRLERQIDNEAGSLHQRDDLTALLVDVQPEAQRPERRGPLQRAAPA